MSHAITEAEALAAHPELRILKVSKLAGWTYRMLIDEDSGQPVGVVGSRSRQQYTDALFIYDRSHIVGTRLLADEYGGGSVWLKDGSDIEEVLHELLNLPEPGEPGAPHLVRATSLLWRP